MSWDNASGWFIGVLVVGAISLLWTLRWLRNVEAARTRRLERRKWFEGTKTTTPLEDPQQETRDRGLENIRRSTTVIRRALVPTIILGAVILATVPFLGDLPTALVSVVVAIATVTTGIAARPVIENTFSGLLISFSKLFNIGDTVEFDGLYGTVEDVTLTHTTLRLWDWRRYIIPNSKMMQSNVINYSLYDTYQWAYVEFWVSHDADLEQVRGLATEAAQASPSFAPYEPPRFWVMELADRGVRCWVAAWANTPSEAWALKHDVRTGLALRLNQHGIAAHAYRVALTQPHQDTPSRLTG